MATRLGRFEMPKQVAKDESVSTDTYGKFYAEPFEAGYGRTMGNSLRRVLLSSLEAQRFHPSRSKGRPTNSAASMVWWKMSPTSS